MQQKKEKRYFEVSLQDRLSDEEYKRLREFQREMNAKDYTRNHRRKKS